MRRTAIGLLVSFSTSARASAGHDPGSLDRLHDVVSPPPISWWPLAPGWVGLAIGLCLLAAGLLWRARVKRQRNRYRIEALAELAGLRAASVDLPERAAALMILLKRTALTAYPRSELASLNGEAWWRYLDEHEHAGGSRFASGLGAALEALAYQDPSASECTSPEHTSRHFLDAAEGWIRQHDAISSIDVNDPAFARSDIREAAPIDGEA